MNAKCRMNVSVTAFVRCRVRGQKKSAAKAALFKMLEYNRAIVSG